MTYEEKAIAVEQISLGNWTVFEVLGIDAPLSPSSKRELMKFNMEASLSGIFERLSESTQDDVAQVFLENW